MRIWRADSMSAADGLSRRGVIGGGAALILASPLRAAAPAFIRTPSGNFVPTPEGEVLAFRGIRYGRAERFQAPRAESRAGDTISAQSFGPVAPQKDDRYGTGSEDCLFLNI